MKSQHRTSFSTTPRPPGSAEKVGLPGTPEEQRRDLRTAMKRHAETLRRLAR